MYFVYRAYTKLQKTFNCMAQFACITMTFPENQQFPEQVK